MRLSGRATMKHMEQEEFFVDTEPGIRLMVASKIPKEQRLGKAVVLVHGSGVGWIYWDIPMQDYSIMDYLSKRGLDVYAVECRGYGKSTKPNGLSVTAEAMAKDLKAVIATILKRSGVTKVSAAGHSSGGMVLMVAAGMYPELLDRMVLIGTPYKAINPLFREYATQVIRAVREHGKDYAPNLHYKDIENRLDAHDKNVVDWYKFVVEENYSVMPGGILPDIMENPGAPLVPTMQVPTLIFNGAKEYVVEGTDSMALFADMGAQDKAFIVQPNSFHLPYLEKLGHIGLQESIYFWVTKS
jgi:alpha-beta hydrolase superfamily lysophospholipase